MQVKIRPVRESWHPSSEYEWQPTPSKNGKWYHVLSKNILKFPYGDPQLRRKTGIETHFIMNALYLGLPVQVRALYDRQARKLFIMEPNGKEVTK